MSRILARVLGVHAGPEPVRPRLPGMFEPGLEPVTGPGPLAAEPDDLWADVLTAGDNLAGANGSPAARLDVPRTPADPSPEPPAPVPGASGVRPASAPSRAAARQAHRGAEAEPAVHITIGQVEIRAVRAPTTPARPAGKSRRVAPDLSEYLQRRGGPR